MSATARARSLPALLMLWVAASPLAAQSTRSDSAAAVATVTQFHSALTAGDSVRATALLSADVMVLEAGAIQTRAEYLGHHLGADMAASKDSKATRSLVQVRVLGDVAYVVSKSVTPPNGTEGSTGSEMAELMVLSRSTSGWTIRAVHWSSRRRKA